MSGIGWTTRLVRRILPPGLAGLAGLACVLCCVMPMLLAAGVLGGAGWLAFGRLLPGLAIALAAGAGLSWWALRRRHVCAGPTCDCSEATA
jgi:mercuric ion transport protein